MKRLALASILSLAATIMIAPMSRASGFIIIDQAVMPAGGLHHARPPSNYADSPPCTSTNHRSPGWTQPPPISPIRPILKGGVSFGLHMQSEDIKVDIQDQVAKTYITQNFFKRHRSNSCRHVSFPLAGRHYIQLLLIAHRWQASGRKNPGSARSAPTVRSDCAQHGRSRLAGICRLQDSAGENLPNSCSRHEKSRAGIYTSAARKKWHAQISLPTESGKQRHDAC